MTIHKSNWKNSRGINWRSANNGAKIKQKVRKEKRQRSQKSTNAAIIMPKIKRSEYAKIRHKIIAQRKDEWEKFEKQWGVFLEPSRRNIHHSTERC